MLLFDTIDQISDRIRTWLHIATASRECGTVCQSIGVCKISQRKAVSKDHLFVFCSCDDLTDLPIYLQYSTHAGAGSMYNTPNCWAIYCCGKVFKYLKSIGGLEEMHKRNLDKAKVFYDFLDSSKMFKGTVEPEFRSLMNIPFVTGSADLDKEVVAATKAAGYDNLKGHKSVGGLRASIYNAMPKEGVEALVEFLKNFEANYGK